MHWFFLFVGLSGGFSSEVWIQAGPFVSQQQCQNIQAELKKLRIAQATECWSVPTDK